MRLFYSPEITVPIHKLNEEESKHCVNVLRLKRSDIIHLIDGKGGFYEAKLLDTTSKGCVIEIVRQLDGYQKHNYYLHIAIAPTKNIDRYEWFIEKAVEIGVDEISPIITEHSERKTIKLERLEKIAIAAMKQSLKAYLPKINPLINFKDFINQCADYNRYIAHCAEGKKEALQDVITKGSNALILIGPEGDFSDNEINTALNNDYKPVTLGNSRLRTETAGIVACHTFALVNEKR